jgi:hypothetical protein
MPVFSIGESGVSEYAGQNQEAPIVQFQNETGGPVSVWIY